MLLPLLSSPLTSPFSRILLPPLSSFTLCLPSASNSPSHNASVLSNSSRRISPSSPVRIKGMAAEQIVANTTTGSPAPNSNPLPDPWAAGGANRTNAAATNPGETARSPPADGLGGLDGLFGGTTPDVSSMQNSAVSQMMQSFLSNPQSMNQILTLNPQLRSMLESNPQLRDMIQNPDFLRQLTSPETMQQMMTMLQSLFFGLGQQQPARQLTAEAVNQLIEGIDLLLGRWSALEMAIQNEWGGRHTRQKVKQLAVDVYHWLIRPAEALYVDDLENLIDDFMLSINTEIDDGSIEDISNSLMIMHEECLEGNFASIERLRQSIPAANHPMQAVNGDEDDSDSTATSGDESMEMADELDDDDASSNISAMTLGEPPRSNTPTVDADGWTVVSSRRNRGGRH